MPPISKLSVASATPLNSRTRVFSLDRALVSETSNLRAPMSSKPLLQTHLPLDLVRRGKVRDVYDLGENLLIVSSDRISAFDWILPTGIPDKGRILTQLSAFWFEHLSVRHHLVSCDVQTLPAENLKKLTREQLDQLCGRSMIVRKTKVVPIECVVRGYLSGSGWKEYGQNGVVCGIQLPHGLLESSRLSQPIFTPATKAESGHDQNISYAEMQSLVGNNVASRLRELSLDVYAQGTAIAAPRGILIADTKFEWGFVEDELILIDEVLTPDSSRFWPAARYRPGGPQASFDKQFVRDWLESTHWDKNSPPPELPDDVVQRTRDRYVEAYERLTGRVFEY